MQLFIMITNKESVTSNKVIIKNHKLFIFDQQINIFKKKTNLFVFTKSLSCFHVTAKKKEQKKIRINKNHITPIIPNLVMFELFFCFLLFLSSWCFFIPKVSSFLPKKKNPTNMIFRYFVLFSNIFLFIFWRSRDIWAKQSCLV